MQKVEQRVMKKRLLAIFIIASMMICAFPVGTFAASGTINKDDKAVLYTPASDYRSGDCILSSSKTMIRRAAIMRGSKLWSNTTNAAIRKDATVVGLLLHNFTHSTDGLAYTVRSEKFKGKTEKERIKEFEQLIKEHPEGVVVWGQKSSIFGEHGILLTGVKNGVVYAADSFYNKGTRSVGIQKWQDTSMYSPLRCTRYWYIKSITIAKGAKAPAKGKPLTAASAASANVASTLKITDATKPTSINKGKGFPVAGVVQSNYRLSNVTVRITNSKGKAVITQSLNPNTWIYDLAGVDAKIKFGSLAAGKYTYTVTAKDEKKSTTLVKSEFTVKAPPKSTLRISSYNAPTRNRKGYSYSIKGKITSNKKITSVTVQVLDSKGKVKLGASAKPNATSYDIKKLDKKIKFGSLAIGSYKYRIVATDATQSKTLVNKAFTVVKK